MSGCQDTNVKCACKYCYCGAYSIAPRIEKLEQHHTYQIDENRKISNHVDDLKKELSFQMEVFKVNFAKIKSVESKKPHKCPVCDGSGKDKYVLLSIPPKYLDCKSCDSKGIVWG